jgi:hypothetical protein
MKKYFLLFIFLAIFFLFLNHYNVLEKKDVAHSLIIAIVFLYLIDKNNKKIEESKILKNIFIGSIVFWGGIVFIAYIFSFIEIKMYITYSSIILAVFSFCFGREKLT